MVVYSKKWRRCPQSEGVVVLVDVVVGLGEGVVVLVKWQRWWGKNKSEVDVV